MAENIKEYREGYQAGKVAGPASIIGHGFFSTLYSDDYREGFRDAQEGRDFNPNPSRLNEPDLADEVGGCIFGIFMSGIELFFRVLFWPVSILYQLLGFKIFFCILLAVLAVVMVMHPFRFRPPAPRESGETNRQSYAIGTEQQPPRTTATEGALAGGTDSVGVEPTATILSLGSFSDGSVQLDPGEMRVPTVSSWGEFHSSPRTSVRTRR